jgi:O-acetylserine/cysteine efflux transporter
MRQFVALAIAATGLIVIAAHTDAQTTPLGLALVLIAALCWAAGNIVAQRAGKVPMLGFMVWSSLFAAVPLLALSWIYEGGTAIQAGLARIFHQVAPSIREVCSENDTCCCSIV